jgi:hypothetical protein
MLTTPWVVGVSPAHSCEADAQYGREVSTDSSTTSLPCSLTFWDACSIIPRAKLGTFVPVSSLERRA